MIRDFMIGLFAVPYIMLVMGAAGIIWWKLLEATGGISKDMQPATIAGGLVAFSLLLIAAQFELRRLDRKYETKTSEQEPL